MNPTPTPSLESELLSGIYSDEEKAQILGQIEQAASSNRLSIDTEVFRPRKQGILFPVAVNLIAAALIVGAWFGADAYFQTRQQGLQLRTDRIFSTESKLLAKVLEDAKNQLEAKNAEIQKIQGDMASLAAEKASLQKSFSERVALREKELRKELDTALSAEKKRLQDLGLGAADIATRLKEFEAMKNAEFNSRLDSYRRQVQGEIDQRSQAVVALQARLQSTIGEQEQLRHDIEKQTKEREKNLQSQLSSQAADIDTLKKDRDDLSAFHRQADAAMQAVRTAFDSGDWTQTQTAVTNLRQILAKAAASASEAVRLRAQAEALQAATLDSAVSALSNSSNKAEANAQVEALRVQLKKEKELSNLQLSESQQTLAATEAKWRQAVVDAEGLRKSVDEALVKIKDTQAETDVAHLESISLGNKVASLEKVVEDLTPYKSRYETLKSLFAAPYSSPKDRFVSTLGSEEGLRQFPDFDPAWQSLVGEFRAEGTGQASRQQALEDVFAFTQYLRGTSESAQAVRDSTERLARADETYRKVIDNIQALSAAGAKESAISTSKTQLYGTVVAVSATKVVLEALTKVRPQVGDSIELRRVQGRKETVLGQGKVLSAADKKVELDWSGQSAAPLSGDPAYLVLP